MNYNDLSNIFESSNARSLNSNQLASEFIWTESFDLLFSEQNQIILGSRGSGKTALIKMLSHENLCKLTEHYPKAKEFIDNKRFIATYIPLKVEWVNSLNNFEEKREEYFIWSLNLSICARLIDSIESCVNYYIKDDVEKLRKEREISKTISELWFDNSFNNFEKIRRELEKIEYKKNLTFNKESMGLPISDSEMKNGETFHTSLFKPFEIASKFAHRILRLPESCKWYVCIDEAEFLSLEHHKILNTYMRSASELVFKITTMPYRHHTLDTGVNANINIGHDLEYIYIDKLGTSHFNQQKSDNIIQDFAEKLFVKRLNSHNKSDVDLEQLVGKSILTQSTTDITDYDNLILLIKDNCNEKTITRAEELYKNDIAAFDDQIARKLRGILLLRNEFNNRSGNSSSKLFSGVSIIARCSDGNPRRLFRLFNHLISNLNSSEKSIKDTSQSERLKSFSHRELEVIKFEKGGLKAFGLINEIGNFFKQKTLVEKLGADSPQSFYVDSDISDENWNSIKTAVDLGLLYPYTRKDKNAKILFPSKEGRFVLANCLAPNFNLLPRIGSMVKLNSIFNTKFQGVKYRFNQLEMEFAKDED